VDGWEIVGRFETLDPEIERIVRSFAAEIATTGLGGELYAEAMATQLAVLLLRRHSSLGRRALGALAREDAALGRPGGALGRAIDYVEVNLGRGLSLVEIAREAGVSPRQLSRLFTEATGLPPHRYVVRRRVERARDLLLRGEMPIAEVAQAVGFYDQAHLARHAKALLGATPGEIARSGRIVHPVGRIVQDR
jgi:AraC family transcriptional regulator